MPELAAIAPINRNIGIADRSQLAANTNGVSRKHAQRDIEVAQIPKPEKSDAAHRDADRHAQPDQDQHPDDAGPAT